MKTKKLLKRIIAGFFIFLVVAVISGVLIFKFCFGGDQIIENVKNFDKESAEEILNIMKEAEEETEISEGEDDFDEDDPISGEKNNASKSEKFDGKKSGSSQGKSQSEKKPEGATARERIMSVASPEEISDGMAILAKVDLGKVNSLRSSGKASELKKYLTSVLTGAEIRRAMQLYSKYSYLL